jgi:tripartite-type tricarboxylate transporter receptor subunit TctC
MVEAGFPDIEGEGWFAFIVPAGTPKDITALLHREVVQIMALPDMRERMAVLGFQVIGNSPDEAAAFFKAEGIRWAKVIRDAVIKAH